MIRSEVTLNMLRSDEMNYWTWIMLGAGPNLRLIIFPTFFGLFPRHSFELYNFVNGRIEHEINKSFKYLFAKKLPISTKIKNQYLIKKIQEFPLLRQKRRDRFQKISGILSRDRMTLVIFGIFSFNFDKKCPLEFSLLKFWKLKGGLHVKDIPLDKSLTSSILNSSYSFVTFKIF